ncbi:MAG: outer membrane beta-barrel protein [Pirellulales bacterium]|nr:outer membrane beta-barrel protein [Pirellulales bacterium]
MRTIRIALIALSLAGITGSAMAQWSEPNLRQPASYQQPAYEQSMYQRSVHQQTAYQPPIQQPGFAPSPQQPTGLRAASFMTNAAPTTCLDSSCAAQDVGCVPGCGRHRCCGFKVGGWLEGGISAAANSPVDRYNGVVTFNDRDGEAQMNQMWLFLDREANTGGYGWAWGGRVDFFYGTDARFTQAVDGLEANWDQQERFYQCALPQFYFDVALNNLTIRTGHFFTPLGYEVVPATGNFFYSHSYTHQYAEPFTHTGIVGIYKFSDQWKLTTGVHRGIDQFDDTDGRNSLNWLGHLAWTSRDERLGLALGINASEQNSTPPLAGLGASGNYDANVFDYALVGTVKLTDRLTWIVQHDWFQRTYLNYGGHNVAIDGYGLNQYWLYTISDRWSAGMRLEWFRDHDGVLVRGLGRGNAAAGGGFAGNFYEITLGLNWKPSSRVLVRPEIRWDWFDASRAGVPQPYDAGDSNDQFMFGCDFILTW